VRVSSSKKMSPGMKFCFSRIFPLPFLLIGAGVGFFGFRGLIRARVSVDWPSTQGTVVASSVERHRSTGSEGRSSTTYHAEILYEFSVDGTAFNGDRVAYGDYGSSSSSHARRIVTRYPEGKSVTVYYMPENPEECLLELGLKAQSWFLFGFGTLCFVVGTFMTIYLPRAMKKQDITEQSHSLAST